MASDYIQLQYAVTRWWTKMKPNWMKSIWSNYHRGIPTDSNGRGRNENRTCYKELSPLHSERCSWKEYLLCSIGPTHILFFTRNLLWQWKWEKTKFQYYVLLLLRAKMFGRNGSTWYAISKRYFFHNSATFWSVIRFLAKNANPFIVRTFDWIRCTP